MVKTIDTIQTGRSVITAEMLALGNLANTLSYQFDEIVKLLLSIEGKVAITGMGKSGHIGRKIAATFSSTGTPSYFIHPAEAAHGDMGILSCKDALICISNSGNTEELIPLIDYCLLQGIPIIGITGTKNSIVGKKSRNCLFLPTFNEADKNNIVPTTSITMSLALGDALALTVMEMRNFTPSNFYRFHPGGILGKKLRTVDEVMQKGDMLPLVNLDTSGINILLEMTGKGFGCTAVINNNGELVGMITDGDLRRHLNLDLKKIKAEELMTENPISIEENTTVSEALWIMNKNKITNIFIVKDKKPLGIVNIHILMQAEKI